MKIGRFMLFVVFCLISVSNAAAAQEVARISVDPANINIGSLFNGTVLNVTGSIPADSEAVVRFIGTSSDLHMKQKEKVGGIMWMNVDPITFKGAPSVCLVSSAVDLNRLEANGGGSIASLRLSGLKNHIRIEAKGCSTVNAFDELVKFKRKEGLYRETFGNISYGTASAGRKRFLTRIALPSRLGPGAYEVELSAVRNGQVIARAERRVTAKMVGFPALLARLAFRHSALYGVLASIIALLAGLGVGLVFQSRGSH